jgi:hypothetical protein
VQVTFFLNPLVLKVKYYFFEVQHHLHLLLNLFFYNDYKQQQLKLFLPLLDLLHIHLIFFYSYGLEETYIYFSIFFKFIAIISEHKSIHSSHIYIPGPAINLLTCSWFFPQTNTSVVSFHRILTFSHLTKVYFFLLQRPSINPYSLAS